MSWMMDNSVSQLVIILLVKATLIVLFAAAFAASVHRTQAEGRLMIWRSALLALAALPFLSQWMPVIPLIITPASVPASAPEVISVASGPVAAAGWSWLNLAVPAYLLGAVLSLTALLRGLYGLRRWRRRASPADQQPLLRTISKLGASLGIVAPVDVRWSGDISGPLSWGWLRPRVLLPAGWRSGQDSILSAALCHELAHVRRRDWLWVLSARLLRTFYWCNPAVAWLCSRLLEDTELACDQLALSQANSPGNYARAVLAAADPGGAQHAMAMAGVGPVRRRIEQLMNPESRSTKMNPSQKLLFPLLVPALVIPLAACQLTQAAEAVPQADVAPVSAPSAPSVPSASDRTSVPAPSAPVVSAAAPTPVALPSPAVAPTPHDSVQPRPVLAPQAAPGVVPDIRPVGGVVAVAPADQRRLEAEAARVDSRDHRDLARAKAEPARAESAEHRELARAHAERARAESREFRSESREARALAVEAAEAAEAAELAGVRASRQSAEVAQLAGELAELGQERQAMARERQRLESELQQYEQSVQRLQQELEAMRKELEDRDPD
jgi:beta-lactamase regulating signal transducer with metallopeptidase domain